MQTACDAQNYKADKKDACMGAEACKQGRTGRAARGDVPGDVAEVVLERMDGRFVVVVGTNCLCLLSNYSFGKPASGSPEWGCRQRPPTGASRHMEKRFGHRTPRALLATARP